MELEINSERLKHDILELAEIGRDSRGGISRPSFSRADLEAREWFIEKMRQSGLNIRRDGAGNLFGRIEGSGKTVMAGSHLDSVINGGKFDGPVGVLAALECLRTVREAGIPIAKPLEVAAFTDEEGNLVGDFLGSRAFIGALTRETLEKGRTSFGAPLEEILQNTGFTIESILNACCDRPEIEAFIELHIEQGMVLETEEKAIGIVDSIAGKNDWLCSFQGRAGHAGTTPFELRRDAFLGLADFALKSTHYVAANHYGSYVTIGKAEAYPGAFSIIPERTEFTLDFRSTSSEALAEMARILRETADSIASTRGLEFSYTILDQTQPVQTSSRLKDLAKKLCREKDYSYMTMPSGAGHDAQILSEVTESIMLFIPCEDGISHSPKENIRWGDLEKGANLMLSMLLELAGKS